jgi:threonyl-tRNA synthetase
MMSGLTRVREFIQDDAHIFCLPEQVDDEVAKMVSLIKQIYNKLGLLEVHIELSTRPPDSIGTAEMWAQAESVLKNALTAIQQEFQLNPGEGAFYGPKIDFHIQDALKRSWQCATIQLDMAMPERFELEYVGSDNARHRPLLLHRTLLGAIERFTGILIEHYGGKFPTWLSPVQAIVLPISTDKFGDYALKVQSQVRDNFIRTEIDLRDESLNKRIRDAQLQKIPYMLIVGERELEAGTVSVRRRDNVNVGALPLDEFIERISREIRERELALTIKKK